MSTNPRLLFRLAVVILGAVLLPGLAGAAGFSIYEQGGRAMGFSGAYTALAQDPSAIFYNPAGIAFLKDKQMYLGATAVRPFSDFTGASPFPGQGVTETGDVSIMPVPTLYYTQPFSHRVVLGIGIDTPFGLRTQWANPDTYTGRYISVKADLKSISLNPTVAFKLADRFSVAAGVDVRFSKIEIVRRLPSINPFTQKVVDIAEMRLDSDWNRGFGFNAGLLAKPTDSLSVGAAYRHKVKVDYSAGATFDPISTGNAQFDALVAASLPSGGQAVTTAIEFPATASGGVAYTFGDWTLAADAVWFQWSTFDRLDIRFTSLPTSNETIVENYANTWQFRVGIERRLNDAWTVRGGYHHDQSPSPAASVSPLLPDADRNGAALGATYRSGRLWIDAGTWYVFFKDRSTEGVNRDHYDGTYSNSAFTLGVSFGYRF